MDVHVTIDGRSYTAQEGQTILDLLRANDMALPTLCFHPALKPSGSCRLCAVEVAGRSTGKQITMLACILKAREGMVIRTQGPLVETARRQAFDRLLKMAPLSTEIRELAKKYQIDLGPPPDGCIRCRLCVRVCKEIVGPGALKMVKKEGTYFVEPIEGACIGCGTCANLCKTRAITLTDQDNVRTITIRDTVIGRHPLERCEGCGRMFATHRFLVKLQERIADHPHVKEPHRYCQNCAKMLSDRAHMFDNRKARLPGV